VTIKAPPTAVGAMKTRVEEIIERLHLNLTSETYTIQALGITEIAEQLAWDEYFASSYLSTLRVSRQSHNLVHFKMHPRDQHVLHAEERQDGPVLSIQKGNIGNYIGKPRAYVTLAGKEKKSLKTKAGNTFAMGNGPDTSEVLSTPVKEMTAAHAVVKITEENPCIRRDAEEITRMIWNEYPEIQGVTVPVIDQLLKETVYCGVNLVDEVEGVLKYHHPSWLTLDYSGEPWKLKIFGTMVDLRVWLSTDSFVIDLPTNDYNVKVHYIHDTGYAANIEVDDPANKKWNCLQPCLQAGGLNISGNTVWVDTVPAKKPCQQRFEMFVQNASGEKLASISIGRSGECVDILPDDATPFQLYLDRPLIPEMRVGKILKVVLEPRIENGSEIAESE
nr:hypothetical protein [Candidatus Sigynarchaeota archaeon]